MKRAVLLVTSAAMAMMVTVPALAKSKDKVENEKFTFNNQSRQYSVQIPSSADATKPLPVVVLLHDQGGWASDVMSRWKNYASHTGFIVVAPEALSNTMWNSQTDGPAYLHAVVDEVNKLHPVDRNRVYLWGQGGGGTYAMALGLYDSQYWAATSVDAGILDPTNYSLFQHAVRKEPFQLWVGDQDPNLSMNNCTNEEEAFKKAGFPFDLKVLINNSGVYTDNYDAINEGSWKFFEKHQLGQ